MTGRDPGARLDCIVRNCPGLNALGANGPHSKAPSANNVQYCWIHIVAAATMVADLHGINRDNRHLHKAALGGREPLEHLCPAVHYGWSVCGALYKADCMTGLYLCQER